MRILHINTARTFRGGEVQTLLLASEQQKRGDQPVIVTQRNSPLAKRAKAVSVETVEFNMRGEWDLLAAKKLRSMIRKLQPEILHAHTPHAASLAILARAGNNCGIVFSRRIATPPSGRLGRLKFEMSDATLAVSKSVQTVLLESGIPSEKLFVAYSATDFHAFDNLPEKNAARVAIGIRPDSFVVGNVSHFDSYKGQERLIQAFAAFYVYHSNSYLLLVGDGAQLARCRKASEELRIASNVIFTGEQLALPPFYAAMDVFFFSSIPVVAEGLPGVVREAMACGIPALAVEQPAVEEIIVHGDTGWLVPADRIEVWTTSLQAVAKNAGLRKRVGQAGRNAVRRFSVEAMADQTEQCYQEVLRRRKTAEM